MNHTIARAVCVAAILTASASFAQEAPSSAPTNTGVPAQNNTAPNEPAPVPARDGNAGNDLAPHSVHSLPETAPSSLEAPASAPESTTQPASVPTAGEKSPRKALWWALSGPIAGASVCALAGAALPIFKTDESATYATMISSCLLFPVLTANAGHIYAGETKHARQKTLRRAFLILASTTAGAALGYTRQAEDYFGFFAPFELGGRGFAVGLGVASILAIREIIDAPKAALRHNQENALQQWPSRERSPEATAPELSAEAPSAPGPDLSETPPALRIYSGH